MGNCYWEGSRTKLANGCRRIDGPVDCGENCPWHQTVEEHEASEEQARQNFKKLHGYDGYGIQTYEHHGYSDEYIRELAGIGGSK